MIEEKLERKPDDPPECIMIPDQEKDILQSKLTEMEDDLN